jgi:hypothetical protein
MNAIAAQIIRMSGLLIELVGVWLVFTERDNANPATLSFPGGSTLPVSWLVVAIGFAVWFIGTVLVAVSRRPRRRLERIDNDDDPF